MHNKNIYNENWKNYSCAATIQGARDRFSHWAAAHPRSLEGTLVLSMELTVLKKRKLRDDFEGVRKGKSWNYCGVFVRQTLKNAPKGQRNSYEETRQEVQWPIFWVVRSGYAARIFVFIFTKHILANRVFKSNYSFKSKMTVFIFYATSIFPTIQPVAAIWILSNISKWILWLCILLFDK
jgi:hypothetical protein